MGTNQGQKNDNTKKNAPVRRIRLGSLQASIWANKNTETGQTYHSATYEKSYKDDSTGEWKTTSSYSAQDSSHLAQLASMVCEAILGLDLIAKEQE